VNRIIHKNARVFRRTIPDRVVTSERQMLHPKEVNPWEGGGVVIITHAIFGEEPFELPGPVTLLPGDTLTIVGPHREIGKVVELSGTYGSEWRYQG